ncbi:MAG: DUF4412 domain-containing protein [Bacteroidota bacterium]|nr:DUF4412 domain-containing protein [Bacteroidota bacterium]
MMKKLTFMVILAASIRPAEAQFTGTLVYQSTTSTNFRLTTVHEKGNQARIDCRIYSLKSGVPDSSTGQDQDPLIDDFTANKETKLLYKQQVASIGPFTDVWSQKRLKISPAEISVTLVGTETINGYSCKHFIINWKISKKELWITQDLGTSPVYILPAFLYYHPGSVFLDKLIAAGGAGIVVKGVTGPANIILAHVDKTSPPSSVFAIPSGYSTRDVTAFMEQAQ